MGFSTVAQCHVLLHYFQSEHPLRYQRTPSTTSEESIRFHSSGSLDLDSKDTEQSKEVKKKKKVLSRNFKKYRTRTAALWTLLQPENTTSPPDVTQVELSSSAPVKEPFLRIGSKRMGKNFNPFSSSSSSKTPAAEKDSQLPTRLLQLAKPKEKKDKKKKKGKGAEQAQTGRMTRNNIISLTIIIYHLHSSLTMTQAFLQSNVKVAFLLF